MTRQQLPALAVVQHATIGQAHITCSTLGKLAGPLKRQLWLEQPWFVAAADWLCFFLGFCHETCLQGQQ